MDNDTSRREAIRLGIEAAKAGKKSKLLSLAQVIELGKETYQMARKHGTRNEDKSGKQAD